MPDYIIAYHDSGKRPESKEAGARQMEQWKVWVGGLGDAIVNPGTPLANSKTVSTGGVADTGLNGLTGFSIVKADTMDAAIEMAKACPYLEMGTLEVAEVRQM